MKWADLSHHAKSILEWTEHVWTGECQVLIIERGKTWVQPLNGLKDVVIDITDELFEEIKGWLPHANKTDHSIQGDTIKVWLK